MNYLTGIKDHTLRFDINLDLEHYRIQLLLKSLAKHPHKSIGLKKIFTVDLLSQLIAKTAILQDAVLYRAIFLTAFHGFFCISNLLPMTAHAFDINKHLARGDVILDDTTAHIIVKWSKTLQYKQGRVIQLAAIPGSPLCPVRALQEFVKVYPSSNNSPFFTMSELVVTQAMARRALAQVITAMGLCPSQFPFHTFRHSGATLAFQIGVPLEHIQAHGTWSSDAVWACLKTAPTRVAPSKISKHISTL